MPWRQAVDLSSFDPETVRILADAVDAAWERVQGLGKPLPPSDTVRLELAKYIVERAKTGERDVNKLVQYALFKREIRE